MVGMIAAIIVTLVLAVAAVRWYRKEGFKSGSYHLNFKTKCASCEADIIRRHGADAAWLANPAKTFSAEVDGVRQAGGALCGGFAGKTVRYF